MLDTQNELFTDTEVIDLCQSIINTHRVLITLSLFFRETEQHTTDSGNGFIFIGLRAVAERFLKHQNMQLTRVMEIYKSERAKLTQYDNQQADSRM